jgi:glutamine synthetase
MTTEQKKALNIKSLPTNLKESLDALKSDSRFLENVFSKDFLETYSSMKYTEYSDFSQTPTPWEVSMYADM